MFCVGSGTSCTDAIVIGEDAALVIDEMALDEPLPQRFSEKAYTEPISRVTPRIMASVGTTWGLCFFAMMALIDSHELGVLFTASAVGGGVFGILWGGWFSYYVKLFHRSLI